MQSKVKAYSTFHQAIELRFAMSSCERFYVQLKPGETTFVSWRKLLKQEQKSACLFSASESLAATQQCALEARNASAAAKGKDLFHPVRLCSVIARIESLYQGKDRDNKLSYLVDKDDQYDTQDSFIDDAELDDYFSNDDAKLKHRGFYMKRAKAEEETKKMKIKKRKKMRTQGLKPLQSGKSVKAAVKLPGPSADSSIVARSPVICKEHVYFKTASKEKTGCCSFKGDRRERLNKPSKSSHSATAGVARRPQSALARAIVVLEDEVTEVYHPSDAVYHPSDAVFQVSGQAKQNRLPRTIKLKIARVAKLAVMQGVNTDKLIKQLMEILGPLMRADKLKKQLEAMVEFCLSALKEKKACLQRLKEEVVEMIKSRVRQLPAENNCWLEGSESPSSCFEKSRKIAGFQWDRATEDRLCDLCEAYIEGMEENKGFHLMKLYAQLIKLWPQGSMDSMGLKLAVHRAKQRRKLNRNIKRTSQKKMPQLVTVKRKPENPEDDRVTVLQLITKQNPTLGHKMRRVDPQSCK